MSSTSRRKILELMVAATLAPTLCSRSAAAQSSAILIDPPAGPMRFQRTAIRQLAGGAQIVVTREFEISFRRFADGFEVHGEQVSVDVQAPANLSVFAELERARVETAMFPVTLNPFGQIYSDLPSPRWADEVERAFQVALSQITSQPLEQGEQIELRQFVASLHQAGTMLTATMPADLFAPVDSERSENRVLPLPSGDIGRVTSHFGAIRDQQTGLMRSALREVRTEIDGDMRATNERWQLH